MEAIGYLLVPEGGLDFISNLAYKSFVFISATVLFSEIDKKMFIACKDAC